ncbi:MAG: PhzF family phenazine biosynthesis protein, partial [Bacilli bacterium]|nr:PhzF family phenazine biosynthesis protein [Bacilli bacterium]
MKHELYRLSSFPKDGKGGNPAGVVLYADLLSDYQMQEIAKEVNFSETAFVSKSEIADFKVRFFTPTNEVDLCGHATIATFNLMRDLGVINEGIYCQETKAGVLNLDVQSDFVYMQQNNPLYAEILNYEDIKNCFKNYDFLREDLPILIMSTGIREIFLPVKSEKVLHEMNPNLDEIIEISNKFNVIGIHAFTVTKSHVFAFGRNFAPAVGIDEESATGTSNGALSCYLNKYVDGSKTEFILGQGYSMGLPSEIIGKLKFSGDEIIEVWVGGSAKIL